jgi:hypothetical protein
LATGAAGIFVSGAFSESIVSDPKSFYRAATDRGCNIIASDDTGALMHCPFSPGKRDEEYE